jgi:hypothetical protein
MELPSRQVRTGFATTLPITASTGANMDQPRCPGSTAIPHITGLGLTWSYLDLPAHTGVAQAIDEWQTKGGRWRKHAR